MVVVASAVAFVDAAEKCVKYIDSVVNPSVNLQFQLRLSRIAHTFVDKIRAYKKADERIAELVLRIEGVWVKTEIQVDALKKVADHSNERLRQFQQEWLRRLESKLRFAHAEVETFDNSGTEDLGLKRYFVPHSRSQKARYAMLESHFRGTVEGLISLRGLLLSGPLSLDAKLIIAKSTIKAILAVHSADFVHKNIRPETIIVFRGVRDRDHSTTAYLVGFERSRPVSAGTALIEDMVWEKNLYRHPNWQGIRPEEVFEMRHDIYSLGVSLLEIGIWQTFVVPSDPGHAKPGKILHIEEQLSMSNRRRAAWEIKDILVKMAKNLLPRLVGFSYTDIPAGPAGMVWVRYRPSGTCIRNKC